jgi:ABC-type lipoprotein release transport system permease subunit
MLMLVFMGMGDGSHEQMIDLGVRQGSAGHVVVQAAGYQKDRSLELLVPNPEAVRREAEAALPGARVVLRAYGGGLAKTSSNSVGVMFAGVEPARERQVSDLPNRIVRGVYLEAGDAEVRAAEARGPKLWCARPSPRGLPVRPAVLGAQLAKTLSLNLCDKLVVDAQGMAEMESGQFRVVGLFETGSSELDGFFLHLPLTEVQRLLHIGRGVHQVAVFRADAKGAAAAAAAVRARVADGGLVVLPWDQALPEIAEFIWLDDASMYVFLAIVFLIVGIGVLNTVLMSVMERIREFGLMRALGAGPARVITVVLAEAAIIGIIGIGVGLSLGLSINHYFETTGLDLNAISEGGFQGAGVAMTGVIYSRLYLSSALAATLSVLGMALVSALYPALRAARLRVLKAIHDV